MKDRLPTKPGRVELQYDDGTKVQVTITRKDEPAVAGTPLNKATLLPDDVCDALGLDRATATPGDALLACNEFWDGYKIWQSFIPIDGMKYDWPNASQTFTKIGNILCAGGASTYDTLKCFNVDTMVSFTIGSEDYDSYNGAFAYDGDFLYVYGHGSSSNCRIYRVSLGSGQSDTILSDTGHSTSYLYTNAAYILGASGGGNRTVWIWDKNGNILGQTSCRYCYNGFMIGDYLYTCDGTTVYRMAFNGSSFSGETSVAFPKDTKLHGVIDDYAQDKTFYGINNLTDILYRVPAASMTVQVEFDFSQYIEVNTDADKAPSFCMSQKRYYYKAYGIIYVFDRSTKALIGKGIPKHTWSQCMISNEKGEELCMTRSGYASTITKLEQRGSPIIEER